MFRWQELDAARHASRVNCLEQWITTGRVHLEPLVPGCGFECLLPDAYHLNLRESDRRVRPYAIHASVHFLTHALNREASELKATVGGFGMERADEYRIGLSIGDDDEVAQGIVWPLLGAENEIDDPSPVSMIRDLLKQAGISDIEIWSELTEPEFCEDCGAPLFRTARVRSCMPKCRMTGSRSESFPLADSCDCSLIFCLLFPSIAGAQSESDKLLAQVLAAVSAKPLDGTPFFERKISTLFSRPLESRGTMSFKPPGVLEKLTTAPIRERVSVANDTIRFNPAMHRPRS